MPTLAQQQIEQLIDRRQLPLEVEAAEIRIVVEAAFDLRRRKPCLEWLVRRCEAQHLSEGFGPVLAGA